MFTLHSLADKAHITSLQKHSGFPRILESEGCCTVWSLMLAGVQTTGGVDITWKNFDLLTSFGKTESVALYVKRMCFPNTPLSFHECPGLETTVTLYLRLRRMVS